MAVRTMFAGALHLRHCYSHVHSPNHSLYLSAKGQQITPYSRLSTHISGTLTLDRKLSQYVCRR